MTQSSEEGVALSAPEKKIARRLAQLRQDQDITLRELSEKTGFSESYLSRVVNLKMPVSVANLAKFAEVFGVSIASFFDSEASSARVQLTVAGAGERAQIRGPDGVSIRLLAAGIKGRIMEPFVVDVDSARPQAPLQSHEGEEFIHVLKGRCRMIIGDRAYDMKSGDSIYFDSGIRHRVEPLGGRPCEILSVVTSRDFTFHGNLNRLINA